MAKTATKGKKDAKKTVLKVEIKKVKLDVGEFRDEKTKEIEIESGKTTVGEALVKAGFYTTIPTDKTATDEKWKLSGHTCTWNTVITGETPTLYKMGKPQAGV